jgi:hypothetical protein
MMVSDKTKITFKENVRSTQCRKVNVNGLCLTGHSHPVTTNYRERDINPS